MIAATLVDEIRRMLAEGRLSQRKIAQTMGVSRGTVNAIALGKRSHTSACHPRREDDGFTPPTGMHVRCPGCGGLTQMPCLLCYIRTRNEARRPVRSGPCRRPNHETIPAASRG
jgi:hypothetical protein